MRNTPNDMERHNGKDCEIASSAIPHLGYNRVYTLGAQTTLSMNENEYNKSCSIGTTKFYTQHNTSQPIVLLIGEIIEL